MDLIKVHMDFIMAADTSVAPDVPSVTLTQEIGLHAAWDGCFLLALLLRVRHCIDLYSNTICCCF